MKKPSSVNLFLILFLPVFLLFNCSKHLDIAKSYTLGVKNAGITTASAFGAITGREITAKGFCWDTLSNPGFEKSFSDEGTGSNSYSTDITGLIPGKKYYIRAYATNDIGTAFGEEKSFNTYNKPAVFTYTPSALSYSNAIASGSVAISSTFNPIEVGICYGTNHNPDLSGSKKTTSLTPPTYNFVNSITTTLTNLTENTTYYVRAYASYSFGPVYGNEQSFITPLAPVIYSISGTVIDVDGNSYKTVKIGTQTWMAENLRVASYNNGDNIVNLPMTTWYQATYGARGLLSAVSASLTTYGYVYNYNALIDNRGIAPSGWHIPTKEEWQILFDKLGGNQTAISQLMATGNKWYQPYCTPNNYSNLSLVPGGYRDDTGSETLTGWNGTYWTKSVKTLGSYAYAYSFENTCTINLYDNFKYNTGCSIRCVKD